MKAFVLFPYRKQTKNWITNALSMHNQNVVLCAYATHLSMQLQNPGDLSSSSFDHLVRVTHNKLCKAVLWAYPDNN